MAIFGWLCLAHFCHAPDWHYYYVSSETHSVLDICFCWHCTPPDNIVRVSTTTNGYLADRGWHTSRSQVFPSCLLSLVAHISRCTAQPLALHRLRLRVKIDGYLLTVQMCFWTEYWERFHRDRLEARRTYNIVWAWPKAISWNLTSNIASRRNRTKANVPRCGENIYRLKWKIHCTFMLTLGVIRVDQK